MARDLWKDEEYIVALYLYRFGFEELGFNYTKIAEIMGRSPDSILMRFGNFLSAENNKSGLDGGGKKSKEMYHRYIDTPREILRKEVINILINMALRS